MTKVKIGLEIHGYIDTNEKLFCRCKSIHGSKFAKPNTNICPICTGQPGSKPMLPNSSAIEKAIQIALLLNCKKIGGATFVGSKDMIKGSHATFVGGISESRRSAIRGESTRETTGSLVWQRKHYSWPDLPKGFQNTISGPYATPVGINGKFQEIKITECHLEEDPAAWNPETGEIDYNRSGSPLIEIVTEPDFSSSEQVLEWLKQLITTLGYIKAIDKNAGIKADVNVSLPEKKGARVEIKNVNSLTNIKNAIEAEVARQNKEGIAKSQETRRYDDKKNTTTLMRLKENAEDYRFISDPDLPMIKIEKQRITKLKSKLPETPQQKLSKLIKQHKIPEKSAEILTKNIDIIEFFEKIIEKVNPKLATRWVTEELLSVLNYNKKALDEIKIETNHFIELLEMIEKKILTELKAKEILRSWKEKSSSPKNLAKQHSQISDKTEIEKLAKKVIKENSKAVQDYKAGKKESLNFLVGQVMKLSNKRADYKTAKEILENLLD
ncbi:MAG: Asp-tRNA(Asn)/Glu-tRNA(Gln) amidotransferase subunit GatB [Candidatus Pacearchaeota archaeon]